MPEHVLGIRPGKRLITPDELNGHVSDPRGLEVCSSFYGWLKQDTASLALPMLEYVYKVTTGIARNAVEVSNGRSFDEVSPDRLYIASNLVELLDLVHSANNGGFRWSEPKYIADTTRGISDFLSVRSRIATGGFAEARYIPTRKALLLDWSQYLPGDSYPFNPGISPMVQMRCDAIEKVDYRSKLELAVAVAKVHWTKAEVHNYFKYGYREYALSTVLGSLNSGVTIASGDINDLVNIQHEFMQALNLGSMLQNQTSS